MTLGGVRIRRLVLLEYKAPGGRERWCLELEDFDAAKYRAEYRRSIAASGVFCGATPVCFLTPGPLRDRLLPFVQRGIDAVLSRTAPPWSLRPSVPPFLGSSTETAVREMMQMLALFEWVLHAFCLCGGCGSQRVGSTSRGARRAVS